MLASASSTYTDLITTVFSTPIAGKVWFATAALALGIVQVSTGARIFGKLEWIVRIPRPQVNRVHRWSGRLAFLCTLPVAFHCIFILGFQDTNTRVLGLMKGDFNGIGGYLQTDQLKRIEASGNAKVLDAESMRVMMMQLNTTRAPLNDVGVRRAINYVFDYDGFNKNILGGLVERNPTPLPNTIWGNPRDVQGYTFDLEKAKA